MISEEFASIQAQRLLTMRLRFHDEPVALLKEYVGVLLDTAVSDDHAKRAVSLILERSGGQDDRPTPGDLRESILRERPTSTVPRKSKCAECGGTGFIQTVIHDEKTGRRYDAVKNCGCHGRYTKPREDTEDAWTKDDVPKYDDWR